MRRFLVVVPAALFAAVALSAQNTRNLTQTGTPAAGAAPDPAAKRATTIADYAKWRTIRCRTSA